MLDQYYRTDLPKNLELPIRTWLFHSDGKIRAIALGIYNLADLTDLRQQEESATRFVDSQKRNSTTSVPLLLHEGFVDGLRKVIQIVEEEISREANGAFGRIRPRLYEYLMNETGKHDALEESLLQNANLEILRSKLQQIENLNVGAILPKDSVQGYIKGLQKAISAIEQAHAEKP